MTRQSLSLSLFALDSADLLDSARALGDALIRQQLDDADADRAPTMITATIAAVADRLRVLARVAQGTADPLCLLSPRVAASPPIDRNDLDVRIKWGRAQRVEHLRRLLRQAESEGRPINPKSKRSAQ